MGGIGNWKYFWSWHTKEDPPKNLHVGNSKYGIFWSWDTNKLLPKNDIMQLGLYLFGFFIYEDKSVEVERGEKQTLLKRR